jgi:hypothetical protein
MTIAFRASSAFANATDGLVLYRKRQADASFANAGQFADFFISHSVYILLLTLLHNPLLASILIQSQFACKNRPKTN